MSSNCLPSLIIDREANLSLAKQMAAPMAEQRLRAPLRMIGNERKFPRWLRDQDGHRR